MQPPLGLMAHTYMATWSCPTSQACILKPQQTQTLWAAARWTPAASTLDRYTSTTPPTTTTKDKDPFIHHSCLGFFCFFLPPILGPPSLQKGRWMQMNLNAFFSIRKRLDEAKSKRKSEKTKPTRYLLLFSRECEPRVFASLSSISATKFEHHIIQQSPNSSFI